MKKRTYKKMQNRLYREIKRRMIAEQAMMFPVPVHIERLNIDTLVTRHLVNKKMIPPNTIEYSEYVKRDMAHQLADKLMDEGYITYFTMERPTDLIYDTMEIEARIKVARCSNPTTPAEVFGLKGESSTSSEA